MTFALLCPSRNSLLRLSLYALGMMSLGSVAEAQALRWTHFGVRPLAMGNAFVAVADDFNALYYNPAGLARLKTYDFDVLNPRVEVSKTTVDFFADLQEFAAGSSGDFDAVLNLLEKNTGKTHYFSLGWEPNFIMRGLGFGAALELQTSMVVHREIAVDLAVGPQLIAPIAFAGNFLEDRLSIGGGIKAVVRGGIDREFSINDIDALSESEAAEEAGEATDGPKLEDYVEGGAGLGFDFGLLFTPIKTMDPTIGISITDFGGTPYKKFDVNGEALGTPDTRLPSVNTGFSMKPLQTDSMYLLAAVDAHAINHPQHYSKKFNLGAEWGFGDIIKVQGGLYQGELTAGFQFDVRFLYIRFATYAEQLGTYAGQHDDLRDRRYALQLKLIF